MFGCSSALFRYATTLAHNEVTLYRHTIALPPNAGILWHNEAALPRRAVALWHNARTVPHNEPPVARRAATLMHNTTALPHNGRTLSPGGTLPVLLNATDAWR